MPKGYHHLTRDQRCQIFSLKSSGCKQVTIAKLIGVSKSTISRELKRNQKDGVYHYHEADMQSCVRRWVINKRPRHLLPSVKKRIEKCLKLGWSPEQIAGRLTLEGKKISHETIYKWIWVEKAKGGMILGGMAKNIRKEAQGSINEPASLIVRTSARDHQSLSRKQE